MDCTGVILDVRDTQNQSDVRNIEMLAKDYVLPYILKGKKDWTWSRKEIRNLAEKVAMAHRSVKLWF